MVTDKLEPQELDIKVHDLSVIKQIVLNKSHSLELVREMLSNSCAKEVRASQVVITHYEDPEYGCSFIFQDDGIGMDYKDDQSGRLNKFLNVGYSKVIGDSGDEFGFKGLGSKLILDAKKVEITTWNGKSETGHRVIIYNPRQKLLETNIPKMPKIQIMPVPSEEFKKSGTTIKVLGYEGRNQSFEKDYLRRYLYWYTIVGATKKEIAERLPTIIFKYGAEETALAPGYPWIKKSEDWKTVVIKDKIVEEFEFNGKRFQAILKGGFTENTSDSCHHGFGLTSKKDIKQYGIRFASKGIPYFILDFHSWKHNEFSIYQKFVNLVVEGDDLWEFINIDRSGLREGEPVIDAFKNAIKKCFKKFLDSTEYQNYIAKKKEEQKRKQTRGLKNRKERLNDAETEYVVYVDSDNQDRILHIKPQNEKDLLALFWKLEGLNVLPFEDFCSIEHTGLEGIDIIANYTIFPDSQPKYFEAVEAEYMFENFLKHGHEPKQTELVICWDIANKDDASIEKIESWLYRKNFSTTSVYIAVVKEFPNLKLVKKRDISF